MPEAETEADVETTTDRLAPSETVPTPHEGLTEPLPLGETLTDAATVTTLCEGDEESNAERLSLTVTLTDALVESEPDAELDDDNEPDAEPDAEPEGVNNASLPMHRQESKRIANRHSDNKGDPRSAPFGLVAA